MRLIGQEKSRAELAWGKSSRRGSKLIEIDKINLEKLFYCKRPLRNKLNKTKIDSFITLRSSRAHALGCQRKCDANAGLAGQGASEARINGLRLL